MQACSGALVLQPVVRQAALASLRKQLPAANMMHLPNCRYVGLLLVTKLLPAGDERTLTAVHDAVGAAFLQRLLLPLSSAAVRGLCFAEALVPDL